MTLAELQQHLRDIADPVDAEGAAHYMKSGPGESGHGLQFLGIRMPVLRGLVPACADWPLTNVVTLLHAPTHDERMLALLIMVRQFQRGDTETQERLIETYLANTSHVNSWALVDTSAYSLLGAWLATRDRAILTRLIESPSLWERRIALIATLHFIRTNDFTDTLQLAEKVLEDPEDLIHKAAGWMLKEISKRDRDSATAFLEKHAAAMPRTMLRTAIEKYPPNERAAWRARP